MEGNNKEEKVVGTKLGRSGGVGKQTSVVKRPMNSFLIFCKRHRALVHAKHPNIDNRSVTRMLGDLWKTLCPEDRMAYENLSKQNKDAFYKANPNFKWRHTEPMTQSVGDRLSGLHNSDDLSPLRRSTGIDAGADHRLQAQKHSENAVLGGLSMLLYAGEQSLTDKSSTDRSLMDISLTDKSCDAVASPTTAKFIVENYQKEENKESKHPTDPLLVQEKGPEGESWTSAHLQDSMKVEAMKLKGYAEFSLPMKNVWNVCEEKKKDGVAVKEPKERQKRRRTKKAVNEKVRGGSKQQRLASAADLSGVSDSGKGPMDAVHWVTGGDKYAMEKTNERIKSESPPQSHLAVDLSSDSASSVIKHLNQFKFVPFTDQQHNNKQQFTDQQQMLLQHFQQQQLRLLIQQQLLQQQQQQPGLQDVLQQQQQQSQQSPQLPELLLQQTRDALVQVQQQQLLLQQLQKTVVMQNHQQFLQQLQKPVVPQQLQSGIPGGIDQLAVSNLTGQLQNGLCPPMTSTSDSQAIVSPVTLCSKLSIRSSDFVTMHQGVMASAANTLSSSPQGGGLNQALCVPAQLQHILPGPGNFNSIKPTSNQIFRTHSNLSVGSALSSSQPVDVRNTTLTSTPGSSSSSSSVSFPSAQFLSTGIPSFGEATRFFSFPSSLAMSESNRDASGRDTIAPSSKGLTSISSKPQPFVSSTGMVRAVGLDGISVNKLMFERMIEAVYSKELAEQNHQSQRKRDENEGLQTFPKTKKQLAVDKTVGRSHAVVDPTKNDKLEASLEQGRRRMYEELSKIAANDETKQVSNLLCDPAKLTYGEIQEQIIRKFVEKGGSLLECDYRSPGESVPGSDSRKSNFTDSSLVYEENHANKSGDVGNGYVRSDGLNLLTGRELQLVGLRSFGDQNGACMSSLMTSTSGVTSNKWPVSLSLTQTNAGSGGFLACSSVNRNVAVSGSTVPGVDSSKGAHAVHQLIERLITQAAAVPSPPSEELRGGPKHLDDRGPSNAAYSLNEQIKNLIVAGMNNSSDEYLKNDFRGVYGAGAEQNPLSFASKNMQNAFSRNSGKAGANYPEAVLNQWSGEDGGLALAKVQKPVRRRKRKNAENRVQPTKILAADNGNNYPEAKPMFTGKLGLFNLKPDSVSNNGPNVGAFQANAIVTSIDNMVASNVNVGLNSWISSQPDFETSNWSDFRLPTSLVRTNSSASEPASVQQFSKDIVNQFLLLSQGASLNYANVDSTVGKQFENNNTGSWQNTKVLSGADEINNNRDGSAECEGGMLGLRVNDFSSRLEDIGSREPDHARRSRDSVVRKSKRSNRAKKYKELVSQGVLHGARKRLDSSACDGNDFPMEDAMEETGYLRSEGVDGRNDSVTGNNRERLSLDEPLISYTDGSQYKSSDFDLEAHIASLPVCQIDRTDRRPPALRTKLRSMSHPTTSGSASQSANHSAAREHSVKDDDKETVMRYGDPGLHLNIVQLWHLTKKQSSSSPAEPDCAEKRVSSSADKVTGSKFMSETSRMHGSQKRKSRNHPILHLHVLPSESIGLRVASSSTRTLTECATIQHQTQTSSSSAAYSNPSTETLQCFALPLSCPSMKPAVSSFLPSNVSLPDSLSVSSCSSLAALADVAADVRLCHSSSCC